MSEIDRKLIKEKKMKGFLKILTAMTAMIMISSCYSVTPGAGEEGILIDKPLLFGHGGVRERTVETGRKWVWFTTDYVIVKTVPVRYDIEFDDIMSNDNTPLDYATYITLRIDKGKAPMLLQNYGENWFGNNVEAKYRNFVREEVSKYDPFDLMSNREVITDIDRQVKHKIDTYFGELNSKAEFPVKCTEIITGRAKPNQLQLDEMNKTAAAIQAKQTQERTVEMEEARAKAERQRAIADKAYMKEMNLTQDQFIMLKIVEKANPNIDVVMGGNPGSMWNIRR